MQAGRLLGMRTLGLISVLTIAVAALVLALAGPFSPRQTSADTANNVMSLTIPGGNCNHPTQPSTCTVPAGATFDLSLRTVAPPATGYIGFSTQIDYSTLLYTPQSLSTEITVNVDGFPGIKVRSPATPDGTEGVVSHGATAGTPPDFTTSFFVGELVRIKLTCKAEGGSHLLQIVPAGPGNTLGAGFKLPSQTVQPAKPYGLTVNCQPPTSTPTNTPTKTNTPTRTPTKTSTPTRTPTNTPTPTPTPIPSTLTDVNVIKSESADPIDSNAPLTYTLLVRNLGLQPATGVVAVDTLPPEITVVKVLPPGCVQNLSVITCTVGNLAANDSTPGGPDEKTYAIVVNAPQVATDSIIGNSVTVSATNEPFLNTGNNKDFETTVVLAPRADLIIEKVGNPDFVASGGKIDYTITVTNIGPETALDVEVADQLPATAAFVSASGSCGAPVAGIVTCALGSVAPLQQKVVNISVTAPNATQDVVIKNFAVVSASNELIFQQGNNVAFDNTPVIAPPPSMVVTKNDSADPVRRLAKFTYTILVQNQGGGDALNVVVADTLPSALVEGFPRQAKLQSVSVNPPGGMSCNTLPNNTFQCSKAVFPANSQVTLTVFVKAPTVTVNSPISNTVTLTSSDADEPPAGNSDKEGTIVNECYDVDGDGIVGLLTDLFEIADLFGISTGNPQFNEIYDFDGNGVIDLFVDIFGVALHFGEVCSP